MKKVLSLTLSLVLVFSLFSTIVASAEKPVTVTVDGRQVVFDVQPRLIGGRTMVPLRAIFESIGATVIWDEITQTVTSYNEVYVVKATIGSNIMTINGEERTIDVAPIVIDDRTLVPARFVAEAFGCDVDWDSDNFVVIITTNPIDYSQVEQDTGFTAPPVTTTTPTTTVPDTVYEPVTSKYYRGTNVPDYTYVTGIEQKSSPYYADNGCVIYTYRHTYIGEYYEAVDYMGYLRDNGWSLYDEGEDDVSVSWYYVKGGTMVSVSYYPEFDEIWISVVD